MATAYTMDSFREWKPTRRQFATLTLSGSFTPASLVVSDTFKFFYIPIGAQIHQLGLILGDMDAHASPTLALSVGDSSSGTLFVSSSTTGQAGGAVTSTTELPKVYTSQNYLIMTASTGAATEALLAVNFFVTLSFDTTY